VFLDYSGFLDQRTAGRAGFDPHIAIQGLPERIAADNDPVFICNALDPWCMNWRTSRGLNMRSW